MRYVVVACCLIAVLAFPAFAQESANFRVETGMLAAGGNPRDGVVPASANFRITMSTLGRSAMRTSLTSASHRIDGGFAAAYRPPGEVENLGFTDETHLIWDAERSAGVYNLYRGALASVGATYGTCEQPDLPDPAAEDGDALASGDGFFYLVTVENRLGEEGTSGYAWDDVERLNTGPCP